MEYLLPFKPTDKILELGGGSQPKFRPNIDIRSMPNVDIVADFNEPLPVESQSYDGIYSSYSIEHISWRNVNNFLKETYRILTDNGILVLITANLFEQAKILVNYGNSGLEWNDKHLGMLFGDQDFLENSHKCGFSPKSISKILTNIGFKDIKIQSILSDFGPTDIIVQVYKNAFLEVQ